jgi:hypothetical protein
MTIDMTCDVYLTYLSMSFKLSNDKLAYLPTHPTLTYPSMTFESRLVLS